MNRAHLLLLTAVLSQALAAAPTLVAPAFVDYGERPVVGWTDVSGNLSCSVNSSNGDSWSGTAAFTANELFTASVQFDGECFDDEANSYYSSVTVTRSSVPTPTLSVASSSIAYGDRPQLEWHGITSGLFCNVSSSNGDYWSGTTTYTANELYASSVQFDGECYDSAANFFTSSVTVSRLTAPNPTIWATATSIAFGITPQIHWSGVTSNLTCTVSSTNGDSWSGTTSHSANALTSESVTFTGECYDSAANYFTSSVTVTALADEGPPACVQTNPGPPPYYQSALTGALDALVNNAMVAITQNACQPPLSTIQTDVTCNFRTQPKAEQLAMETLPAEVPTTAGVERRTVITCYTEPNEGGDAYPGPTPPTNPLPTPPDPNADNPVQSNFLCHLSCAPTFSATTLATAAAVDGVTAFGDFLPPANSAPPGREYCDQYLTEVLGQGGNCKIGNAVAPWRALVETHPYLVATAGPTVTTEVIHDAATVTNRCGAQARSMRKTVTTTTWALPAAGAAAAANNTCAQNIAAMSAAARFDACMSGWQQGVPFKMSFPSEACVVSQ